MKINLISVDNGVGLTQDVNLCREILKEHTCKFFDVHINRIEKADINIFFEIPNSSLYPFAKYNLFFPNPEWFWFAKQLKGIDIVLCKTRDAERLFSRLGCQTVYTSFTSRDMYEDHPKLKQYLHLVGKSANKGTKEVFTAWNGSALPNLVLAMTKDFQAYTDHSDNILTIFERQPDEQIKMLLNSSAFHVCTSDYEGFGHYIWEAKSTGGIVITTNGEPMSDFVRDGIDGFLVSVGRRSRQQMATLCHIWPDSLKEVVKKTMALTDEQLNLMAVASRQSWEQNDAYFRDIFVKIIDSL